MRAIETCRTAELGGHIDACDQCGHTRISYNSCRNRHCPQCQFLDKGRWVEAQQHDLLPVPYFHLVFTLPGELGPLALRHQPVVYNLLFKAAWQTLLELSQDPDHLGAQIGCTALLHTWSQTLAYHPHLHCIVTGGGLSTDGQRWVASRKDFFLPVKGVSRLFRGMFHVLPHRFVKIRHYGLLSTRNRKTKLPRCRLLLGQSASVRTKIPKASWYELLQQLTGVDPRICPVCGQGHMVLQSELASIRTSSTSLEGEGRSGRIRHRYRIHEVMMGTSKGRSTTGFMRPFRRKERPKYGRLGIDPACQDDALWLSSSKGAIAA